MSRAVVLILVLCLCAGCGSSNKAAEGSQSTTSETTTATNEQPQQDPADFLEEVLRERALGQWGRAWDKLVPFHQAVVSREKFVDCESPNQGDSGEIKKIEVVDQYEEPSRIPGQPKDTTSHAVTFRITLDVPGLDKPYVTSATTHAVAVNGQWHWILQSDDYRAYKAHRCPPAS